MDFPFSKVAGIPENFWSIFLNITATSKEWNGQIPLSKFSHDIFSILLYY